MSGDGPDGRREGPGRYLVVGAGAVGALLAAHWAVAGVPVVLVARGAALGAVRAHGVRVRRPHGDETIAVPVVGDIGSARPTAADTVVLAVKTQDAEAAVAAIAWQPLAGGWGDGGVVADLPILTLQNGLAAEDIALRRFARVVGVSLAIAASHLDPGVVVSPSWPTIGLAWLGDLDGSPEALAPRHRDAFALAGYAASVVPDIRAAKRRKLLGNLRNVVEVFDVAPAGRDAAIAALRAEAVELFAALGLAVADDDGARLDVGDVPGHVAGRLSTWQSLQRGVSVESDFLIGEIVLHARRAGRTAPLAAAVQRALGAFSVRGDAPGTVPLPAALAVASARVLEESKR